MNIIELCAKNIQHYVDIAIRLGNDVVFYNYMRTLIKYRAYLMWEDLDVVHKWSSFISTAVGTSSLNWNDFLLRRRRNASLETSLRNQRDNMRNKFVVHERKYNEILYANSHATSNMDCMENVANEKFELRFPRMFSSWYFEKEKTSLIRQGKIYSVLVRKKSVITYQKLTRLGYIHEAFEYASRLLSGHFNFQCLRERPLSDLLCFHNAYEHIDIELIVDLGALKYFLGNHQTALELCEVASSNTNSSLVNVCIGVTGTYLDTPGLSLHPLGYAWQNRFHFDKISSYIFRVPLMSIVFNLLSSLNAFARIDECISFGTSILDISLMDRRGIWILFSSLLSWTTISTQDYVKIARELRKDFVNITMDAIFLQEVFRIQSKYQDILNVLAECCYRAEGMRGYVDEITNEIMSIMHPPNRGEFTKSFDMKLQDYGRQKKATIITQYYEDRYYESDIQYALQSNLNNEQISKIVLLNEIHFNLSNFMNASKIISVIIGTHFMLSF